MVDDCIFCQIVAGLAPSHRIFEDDRHLAFLSIFPNTEGVTVAIPKAHLSSYAFETDEQAMLDLIKFSKKVGLILDQAFSDVARTGLVLEGFGVDHLHAKLFPLHGTVQERGWEPIRSDLDTYFSSYPGYISSHDSVRCADAELSELAERIRSLAAVVRND